MTGKKFIILTLGGLFSVLLFFGGLTAVIDPLFHYHAPLDGLGYPIVNERYQNDGILRNFDYDAIITGTSMTENFKSSEFDALFGANSVKVPFSGGFLKEFHDRLQRAFQEKPHIRYVLLSLDYYAVTADKDKLSNYAYPTYLYDDSYLNDVQYLLNKSILLTYTAEVLYHTASGQPTTSFDEYANWMPWRVFGKDAVDQTYSRPSKSAEETSFSEDDALRIRENLSQNVLSLARAHPETDFYLFLPPYSIYTWDKYHQAGMLNTVLEGQSLAIETLLGYDNVHVFSFNDCFDMICDLDNYKDIEHYGEWVNSQILDWMSRGEHELTWDNYQDYCDTVREFYINYDYDSLFTS